LEIGFHFTPEITLNNVYLSQFLPDRKEGMVAEEKNEKFLVLSTKARAG